MIEGIIPSRNNDELSFEEQRRLLEEQRRLFYVAITRPKRTLILSSVLTLSRQLAHKIGAIVGQGNRDTVETITSNFLSELGPDCPISIFGEDW